MSGTIVLPNLIIAGAPKCGTSSFFKWLSDHPQVLGSKLKETSFFVDPGSHTYNPSRHFLRSGLRGYEELFDLSSRRNVKIVAEATPGYLYSDFALRELPDLPSMPKFVFIVRDPADQLLSTYKYFRENWHYIPPNLTFREFIIASEAGADIFRGNELAVHAVRNAHYVDFLDRWRERCGRERVIVYAFEEIFNDPVRFMTEFAEAIGIDSRFYGGYSFESENRTYLARWRGLQTLNLRVRSVVPNGPIYNALRSAYRHINTKMPEVGDDEMQVQRELRARYHDSNMKLFHGYSLETELWG